MDNKPAVNGEMLQLNGLKLCQALVDTDLIQLCFKTSSLRVISSCLST
jgi:hypothetical protein